MTLPQPFTRFIGRKSEVAALHGILSRHRLVTLTGPGGIGKTRLGVEVAHVAMREYADGVEMLELASLVEGSQVQTMLAATLGTGQRTDRSLLETLAQALQEQRRLIIFDNCEHVVQACAALMDFLLQRCPDVRILATSREALGIPGEVVWNVPPLQVPGSGIESDPEKLSTSEAVQLFVDRARLVVPEFGPDLTNAPVLARICRRLDGLPLAIELAAARLSVLSLQQIQDRLDDQLRLLSSGPRQSPARQQTLRGTLDWSYAFLSVSEQRLFARLSVFSGGFTLQAVEAVCVETESERRDVLEHLQRLVARSLVTVDARGAEEVRYRMLEPVRQYATEWFDQQESAGTLRESHARFFAELAEQADAQLGGPGQRSTLARLRADDPNTTSALRWCAAANRPNLGLRLAGALATYWWSLGQIGHGLEWFRTFGSSLDQSDALVRARALEGMGHLTQLAQDTNTAVVYLSDSLELWRQLGDERGVARALRALGEARVHLGQPVEAQALLRESLSLFECLEEPWGVAQCLTSLAHVAQAEQDYDAAAEWFQECLAVARQHADAWHAANSLHGLGHLSWINGDYGRSGILLAESLGIVRELQDRRGAAVCLESLSLLAGARGDLRRAVRLLGAAARLRSEVGARTRPWLRTDFDRGAAEFRALLGDAVFDAEWVAGQALPIEDAMAQGVAASGDGLAGDRAENPPLPGLRAPLSQRELQVASLVARGLNNRRIGEELVITEGTVNVHVKNILRKLGLTSRVQIATWFVTDTGLMDGEPISQPGDGMAVDPT